MALTINKTLANGVTVPFWVTKPQSTVLQIAIDAAGVMVITGAIALDGYLTVTHYTSGTYEPVGRITIADLTQDECGDIIKKSGRVNYIKEVYKIIVKRSEWSAAVLSNEDDVIIVTPVK
jgi:sulfur carrier protein ThiS